MMDTNQQASHTDAERYFTVETARGYILINRKYEYVYTSISLYAYSFVVSKINPKVLIFCIFLVKSMLGQVFYSMKWSMANDLL